jgi:glycerol-3-phosphate dehydrogenase (NAD(P)+)
MAQPASEISHIRPPIAVIGAGSWGTALAILLSGNGYPIWLWGRDPAHIDLLASERCNKRFLPGIRFPELITPSADLPEILEQVNDVLIAVPSAGFRATLKLVKPYLKNTSRIIWATKGMDPGTGKLLHEVIVETLGDVIDYAIISGPSFAHEVAAGLPTAITVASNNSAFATDIASRLHNIRFRAYTSEDVIGVEIGGSVKNVLAIAAGCSDGLGFGANSRAALVTRGLAELMRFGVVLGGQRETFMGLAGLGDLILTCTDDHSRNRRLGLALAKDKSLDDALREIGQVVEGAQTVREVVQLARQHNIEMPITEQVHRVLYEGLSPRDAVNELFARELKPEVG